MAAQTTFINNLLNAAFRGATYTGGTITMKLFTTNIPSAGGVEVTGGGYAAQTLTFAAPSAKKVQTSTSAVYTNLPTSQIIVAYGVYSAGVLIDEKALDTPFQADVNTNSLTVSYSFELGA